MHTFLVLFFHWTPPDTPRIPIIVLTLDWLFITLLVAIAYGLHGHRAYYGITGLCARFSPSSLARRLTARAAGCWITALYPVERIALEYFWLWAAALLNVLLYIPLFFALRGNIVVAHAEHFGGWPRISFRTALSGLAWARPRDAKFHMRMARLMLLCAVRPPTLSRC